MKVPSRLVASIVPALLTVTAPAPVRGDLAPVPRTAGTRAYAVSTEIVGRADGRISARIELRDLDSRRLVTTANTLLTPGVMKTLPVAGIPGLETRISVSASGPRDLKYFVEVLRLGVLESRHEGVVGLE
ncbi:MAG: hypothetical protein JNK60_19605 [Acidobacteria bacterium]|nr:hypothetical protein [Acidobacteriota bacterium]